MAWAARGCEPLSSQLKINYTCRAPMKLTYTGVQAPTRLRQQAAFKPCRYTSPDEHHDHSQSALVNAYLDQRTGQSYAADGEASSVLRPASQVSRKQRSFDTPQTPQATEQAWFAGTLRLGGQSKPAGGFGDLLGTITRTIGTVGKAAPRKGLKDQRTVSILDDYPVKLSQLDVNSHGKQALNAWASPQ